MLKLYNSLTRKKEEFKPLNPPNAMPAGRQVGMYSCGPTVYDFAHIGHMRRYVGDDILKRVLVANGYEVKHVMNVTDVGHLTSDADEGEDKIEKGAREQGKSPAEIAKFFEEQFFASTDALNIERPDITSRATEHIEEQIELIRRLAESGYTYKTDQGVYFDISKFADYTKLSGQKLEGLLTGAREEVVSDPGKKHPADFALWLFTVGRFANHVMHWTSAWGEGFPGWHIECSAMSMKYLGDTLDIHTGGVDHVPIHHTNEIAQSEAATGKPFSRFWVHHEFLQVEGKKMSKSLKNLFTVEDVKKRGFEPLALRYLYLTAHYRDPLNFTWESLAAAQAALERLRTQMSNLTPRSGTSATQNQRSNLSNEKAQKIDGYRQKFEEAVNDDLNTPQALAVLWEVLKSNIPAVDKRDLVLSFDEVLGLEVRQVPEVPEVPKEIMELVEEREKSRKEGKWQEADEIREKIQELGYSVEDTPEGARVRARNKLR